MSRILVIHASRDGQAAAIARRIGRVATDAGHAVTELPVDDPAIGDVLGQSDVVVIGAGVRYGSHGRRVFSVCMSAARECAGQREAARYVAAFVERTGWSPERTAVFAGALRYTRYNFLLRAVMRMISRSVGGDTDTSRDYEYTDWAAVDRFAAQVTGERPRLAA